MVPGHIFPAYPLNDYYLWGFTYRLLRAILQMDEPTKIICHFHAVTYYYNKMIMQ